MLDDGEITTWLTDMDGVLVHEEDALPGAADFLAALRRFDRQYLVLTNNWIYTPRDLSGRLHASGIDVPEAQVFITAGAKIVLVTVLQSLTSPGEGVMAEEVNYALLRTTFRNAHLTPVPLAMDEDGLVPDAFEKAARVGQAKLLYLVPSLQNPTTNTMSRRTMSSSRRPLRRRGF